MRGTERTGAFAVLALAAALAGCSTIGDGQDAADAAPLPSDAGLVADAAADAAREVEVLVIPTDGTIVTTAAATDTGSTYRLQASGVFRWGTCDATNCPGGAACSYERYADAFHRTDDCWSSITVPAQFSYISLYIDGEQIDWGPYRADHVYTIEYGGTGVPFEATVVDCEGCYVDNVGQLELRVERLGD